MASTVYTQLCITQQVCMFAPPAAFNVRTGQHNLPAIPDYSCYDRIGELELINPPAQQNAIPDCSSYGRIGELELINPPAQQNAIPDYSGYGRIGELELINPPAQQNVIHEEDPGFSNISQIEEESLPRLQNICVMDEHEFYNNFSEFELVNPPEQPIGNKRHGNRNTGPGHNKKAFRSRNASSCIPKDSVHIKDSEKQLPEIASTFPVPSCEDESIANLNQNVTRSCTPIVINRNECEKVLKSNQGRKKRCVQRNTIPEHEKDMAVESSKRVASNCSPNNVRSNGNEELFPVNNSTSSLLLCERERIAKSNQKVLKKRSRTNLTYECQREDVESTRNVAGSCSPNNAVLDNENERDDASSHKIAEASLANSGPKNRSKKNIESCESAPRNKSPADTVQKKKRGRPKSRMPDAYSNDHTDEMPRLEKGRPVKSSVTVASNCSPNNVYSNRNEELFPVNNSASSLLLCERERIVKSNQKVSKKRSRTNLTHECQREDVESTGNCLRRSERIKKLAEKTACSSTLQPAISSTSQISVKAAKPKGKNSTKRIISQKVKNVSKPYHTQYQEPSVVDQYKKVPAYVQGILIENGKKCIIIKYQDDTVNHVLYENLTSEMKKLLLDFNNKWKILPDQPSTSSGLCPSVEIGDQRNFLAMDHTQETNPLSFKTINCSIARFVRNQKQCENELANVASSSQNNVTISNLEIKIEE